MMDKKRKDVLVGCRVSEEEREQFKLHAAMLGRTPSYLLRRYIQRVIKWRIE